MASQGNILGIAAYGELFPRMMRKRGSCSRSGRHSDRGDRNQKDHGKNGVSVAHRQQRELKNMFVSPVTRDPVFGMEVKKDSTSFISERFGRPFRFWSVQCRKHNAGGMPGGNVGPVLAYYLLPLISGGYFNEYETRASAH